MILVSAGHHPYGKGACYRNFCEYDEAKVWQSLLVNFIGSGAMAVPTGVLKEKVKFMRQYPNATLAVEIHFNAAVRWVDKDGDGVYDEGEDEHMGRGSETLYYPGSKKGKAAAEHVQTTLGEIFKPNRGAKEGWYKMNPEFGPDYFLARTRCTALIIEPEFIHRSALIQVTRERACKALAKTLQEVADGAQS